MASPRVERILRHVSETAAKLMDLDSFYAALLDETTGQLAFPFAVSNGNELETGEGKWAPRPYKGQAVLPDYVMESDHPVLAEPDLKSWMAANKVAYWEDQVPLSWLGAPMVVGTKALGVLVAENYGKARAFDSGTLTVLSSIASQAATAIANARLYERLDRLNEVGQRLTSGIRLRQDQILELIYEQASQLMDTRNMYIALYDEETDMVSFGLAMQDGRHVDVEKEKGWGPRKAGKGRTEEIIRTQEPILHRTKWEAEQWYATEHEEYIGNIASAWLGVPMMVGEKALGVIATYNWEREEVYDKDDLEVLQTMANQAAIAIDNAVLYYDINLNLERRVRDLQVLNEIGRRLTLGIRLRQDKILKLIYKQASQLMDTRNMYIALYDEATDMVSFGLAMQDGKHVDVEREEGWAPRKAGKGATEEVIRTRMPLLLRTEREAEDWYAKHAEYIGLVPNAWLGVPMMVGEKVLGVIALRNHEQDNAYDQDDLEVLQTMASQAAIAIENARLFSEQATIAMENARLYSEREKTIRELQEAKDALQNAQSEILAAERLTAASRVASEFAHRLNNIAGTIPVRVGQIKELVSPSDPIHDALLPHLDGISQDTRGLLKAAQEIKRTSEPRAPESIDVNTLLSSALTRVRSWMPTNIEVQDEYDLNIPPITAVGSQFVETLINLLTNAVQAMPNGGTLTICSRFGRHRGKRCIELAVADTGCGIPKEHLPKVFDLFFTTKPGGLGYGLWRDKNFIEGLGGEIDVESEVGEGSTFTIRVPVEVEK